MAISANTVFEVRTTGSDNNGGGWVVGASGTDFSQQDSAQFALTSVTSSGSGNTVLSSSAANSMVGNIAQVISGTNMNTGFFQVTSVVVGTSITFSTNAASASICTGAAASGVINIGGALATIGKAVGAAAANNAIWVKATASYAITSTITVPGSVNDLPNTSPNYLTGYTTTRGDNGQVTVTTSSAIIMLTVAGQNWIISNFIFDAGQTATYGVKYTAGNSDRGGRLINVKVQNGATAYGIYSTANVVIVACRVTGMKSGATMAFGGTGNLQLLACLADGNSCDGIDITGSDLGTNFLFCVSAGNTGIGFKSVGDQLGNVILFGCVAYNNTSHGISTAGSYQALNVLNCVLVKNGGYGLTFTAQQKYADLRLNYNAYGSSTMANTSGAVNNCVNGPNDITTLSADPFTAAGSLNFGLNNNNPGGAQLRATAFPGAFSLAGTSYLDRGAVQHQDTGGGGSVIVIED